MTRQQFTDFLTRHRAGGLLDRCGAEMARVIAGVHQTGKTGSLTVKLVVKPAPRGGGAVYVVDDVKTKAPEVEAEASFWFASESGKLSVDHPDQRTLAFTPEVVQPPADQAAAGQ